MATRKFYDPDEYQAKTDRLFKILAACDQLDVSDSKYRIFGSPGELNDIAYLPAGDMNRFAELADFDCRKVKLINYGRPAIELSFFTKHKYFVDKKPDIAEVKAVLHEHVDKLTEQYIDDDSSETNQLLEVQIKKLKGILKRTDSHQYAFSNYSRSYTYAYVLYRYFTGVGSTSIDSANSHLIKHTTDRDGHVTIERTNVIFVDVDALIRRIGYDNKQVDTFLADFKEIINCGKYDLYIK